MLKFVKVSLSGKRTEEKKIMSLFGEVYGNIQLQFQEKWQLYIAVQVDKMGNKNSFHNRSNLYFSTISYGVTIHLNGHE